jgi:hypothetical protein
MESFNQFCLSESFRNFVGIKSIEDRKKWASQVWDVLQQTYQGMGGVKGSGFESMDAMIQKIPFWKLYVQNGIVRVVVMYKDSAGRKIVAVATDKSPKSKEVLKKTIEQGLKIAWGEQSKSMLKYSISVLGVNTIKVFAIKPQIVSRLLNKPVFNISPEIESSLGKIDAWVYNRYKNELNEFFYAREIGGQMFLKLAIGTPNIDIK